MEARGAVLTSEEDDLQVDLGQVGGSDTAWGDGPSTVVSVERLTGCWLWMRISRGTRVQGLYATAVSPSRLFPGWRGRESRGCSPRWRSRDLSQLRMWWLVVAAGLVDSRCLPSARRCRVARLPGRSRDEVPPQVVVGERTATEAWAGPVVRGIGGRDELVGWSGLLRRLVRSPGAANPLGPWLALATAGRGSLRRSSGRNSHWAGRVSGRAADDGGPVVGTVDGSCRAREGGIPSRGWQSRS